MVSHRVSIKTWLRRAQRALLRPLRDWQAPRLHRWMMQDASRPFEPTVLPALVIAPHHDDETFGCGGMIALKRLASVNVDIAILTEGRMSHGSLAKTESDRLAGTRKQEALAAIAHLGVPPERVHFFDLPDQGLGGLSTDQRSDAIKRLAALMRAVRPEEVYVNHRSDRHPDHEAAYQLTDAALKLAHADAQIFQYPIWLIWKGPARLTLRPAELSGALRLDIRSVRLEKERAIAEYRSQHGVLPPGFLNQFQQDFEIFFR